MASIRRKVVYEEELHPEFAEDIASTAWGENLRTCIQCGTCSGSCPFSIYMDFTPRRIIAMTRAGFKDRVLNSTTIWLCASCYQCTVECPKQIHITDVMYALKQRAMRDGVYPKRFPTPVLAREFFNNVMRYGRNSESELLVRLYLKTNPFLMVKQAFLGLGLFLRGRLGLLPDRVKKDPSGKGDLHTMMRALDASAPDAKGAR
jgi:quinone-modifying oxidoreductase, subunit QmoC